MGYGKKNTIKIDPLSYNIGLIGESGIGKTTIIKEMCEKLVGEDGYRFLECGKEDGADGINGINYLNCPEWSMDYDEETNSIGFEDFVDDVVENKSTEYPDLKTVVIDTYDQLVEIAKPEVIRMHNAENPEKPVKSIKAAFGGYMAGEDKATEIVLNKLWELKSVGVHFIIIGHVKQRTQDDVTTGQTYVTARETFYKLLETYDYYEIQPHDFPEQKRYNEFLYAASKQTGKPLIAGTDTHSIDYYTIS